MKEVVLGLLGLGNIGGGVWDLIREFGAETAKRTGVQLRVKKALLKKRQTEKLPGSRFLILQFLMLHMRHLRRRRSRIT